MKLVISLLLIINSNLSFSKTAEEKGHEIAQNSYDANSGYISESTDMALTLIDAHGTEVVREMKGKTIEVENDGSRRLMVFKKPLDVKGTKLLTWSHKKKDNQQWLYFPSLRRVKRITSSNKSSSFMGSEFSYEDFGNEEVNKYTYKLIKETSESNRKIWIYECYPITDSGYSKQVIWLYQDIQNPKQIEFFDLKGELLKIATFSNYEKNKIQGKMIVRANKIYMKNVQTRKESIIVWKNRIMGDRISEKIFKSNNLKK